MVLMDYTSVLCYSPAFNVIQEVLAYYSACLYSDSSHASDLVFSGKQQQKYVSFFLFVEWTWNFKYF